MSAEDLVLEHSKYLIASGICNSKQEAVKYAIKKCLPAMYFTQISQMYNILICEAEEDFVKNIIDKMTDV